MQGWRWTARVLLAAALSLPLGLGQAAWSLAQETSPAVIPESPLNLPPKPKPLRRSYSSPVSAEPAQPASPKAKKVPKARKAAAPPSAAPRHAPKQKAAAKPKTLRPAPTPPPAAPKAKPGGLTRAVQDALHRLGYPVPRDGKLDHRTRQVLRKFQRDHHLPVTGKIDRATRAKLGLK